MSGGRVSNAACALYALPHAAATFAMTLVLVAYMIYATDVLHLPAALAGAIFLAAKLWDALSVPLAGQWSDATRSRLGRPPRRCRRCATSGATHTRASSSSSSSSSRSAPPP